MPHKHKKNVNLKRLGWICLIILLIYGCFRNVKERDIVGIYVAHPSDIGLRKLVIYPSGVYTCEYLDKTGLWLINTNSWTLFSPDWIGRANTSVHFNDFCNKPGTSGAPVTLKSNGGVELLIDEKGWYFERVSRKTD